MSAPEKYDYPSSGSPTTSFYPSLGAELGKSYDEPQDGVLSDQSSSGKEYRYKEGGLAKFRLRSYRGLPDADKAAFEALRAAAGAELIKLTDYDGSTHTVALAPGAVRFMPMEGGLWAFDVLTREEL
jgi:hypothetical protein